MGNHIPESHNHSSDKRLEANVESVVKGLVTDLVNAVHIMSETKEMELIVGEGDELDQTSYFEANESFNKPLMDSEDTFYRTDRTLVPNTVNDFMELTMNGSNQENDYSPKRSGSSSPASDWKYSTYSSSNDYSKPYQNSKYNEILDSWNLNRDDKKVKSRSSLMQNFDPLYGTQSVPSPPERRKAKHRSDMNHLFIDEHNDSTDLIADFNKCRIAETPKSSKIIDISFSQPNSESKFNLDSPHPSSASLSPKRFSEPKLERDSYSPLPSSVRISPKYLSESKPDVLASAVQQQKYNELEDRITELEKESKEKDLKLSETTQQLDQSLESEKKLIQLTQTLHDINEELVSCATQKLNSIESDLINAIESKGELEKTCNQLREELSSIKRVKIMDETQAFERIRQLEDNCNHLMARNASMEKQLNSSDGKKEMESEIITYKVQIKRMEMKVNALENQLQQKCKENVELSAMVDELIGNVHK